MQKRIDVKTIEVELDKLIDLYCYLNNRVNTVPRKHWYSSLFLGQPVDDVEDFFVDLKGRLVDLIDSGLETKSELTRNIVPILLKRDDVKKYLKS